VIENQTNKQQQPAMRKLA